MPTRADIEAATPKCPQPRRTGFIAGQPQHVPCDQPLVWTHAELGWACEQHGEQVLGEQLAATSATR